MNPGNSIAPRWVYMAAFFAGEHLALPTNEHGNIGRAST